MPAFVDLLPLAGLAAVGVVAGALNVVAAGGSFLSLPTLILLGLPAAEANATNRVGVFAQNIAGVAGYHQARGIDWRWALAASVPALAGAALGTSWALVMSDFAFRRLLAMAMLLATFITVARTPVQAEGTAVASPWRPLNVAGFFLIGVYGGLIQAGVGFAILAATSSAGMDLLKGNAVKVLAILLMTALSLVIFASGGVVHWPYGLALALGNLMGATLGVRLAVRQGHAWVQRVVMAAVLVFAVVLWFDH